MSGLLVIAALALWLGTALLRAICQPGHEGPMPRPGDTAEIARQQRVLDAWHAWERRYQAAVGVAFALIVCAILMLMGGG